MTLSFLSPRASAQAPARSPLLDAAIAAGALTALRDGWESIVSFGDPAAEAEACREAVGFADASELTKLELHRPAVASAPGCAERVPGGWRCPVRRTRELLLCAPAQSPSVREAMEEDGAAVCDLTSSLAAISVAGPGARETIARFCAIDTRAAVLPVGGFRPGSIARTPGFLLREDADRFLLLFGAGYGAYLWDVVSDAAVRLGGRPVGAAAIAAAARGHEEAAASA